MTTEISGMSTANRKKVRKTDDPKETFSYNAEDEYFDSSYHHFI